MPNDRGNRRKRRERQIMMSPGSEQGNARTPSLLTEGEKKMDRLINRTRLPGRAAGAGTTIVLVVLSAFASMRLGPVPARADTADQETIRRAKTIGQVKPPFTFTIKTTTPQGQPQAGVRIHCVHPRPERGKALVDMTVATNETGTAQFVVQDANLLADRYFWFDVADERFAGSGPVGISPVDHEFEWTFKALPVQERKLRIVSEQGAGVAGAQVWIGAPDVFLHASPSAGDKDGNVTVKCPPTKLTIGVAAPGYASTVVEEVELTGPDARIIQLQPGQEIRGQVVDARNQPVPGMVVRARKEAPFHYLDEFMPQAHTAADGRFTLTHVAPGDWEVTARSEDPNRPFFVAPATASVTTGKNVGDITLAAQQGFRIKGRYITPRRAEVRLSGARRDISLSVNAPARANWREQTREDGTFDLWSLPCEGQGNIGFIGVSGFHEIVKAPQVYPFFQVVDRNLRFENVPPGTYEGFEVHFLLAGRVEGTVTDGSGKPLRDVEVVVNPPGYIQKVNEEGRFTSEAAPGADVTVTVRKGRDQVLLITEPFRLQEGEIVEKNLMVTGGAYGAGPSPVGRQMPVLASLGVGATPDALEGKRVLLCFFDMNQRPSRRFVPELAARARDLEKNNVVTFLIHAGQADKNAVEQWLRERSVPFATGTVSGDTTRLVKDWTVQALPWLVLLDEKLALAATGFDLQQLDENLKGESLEQLPVVLDWRAKFDLVYGLNEGQILKRIAPPFIPERQQYYTAENEMQASLIPRGPDRMIFHWDGGLRNWGMSFGDQGRLGSTLSFVLNLKSYEYEGPEDLLNLELPGDWVIRNELPMESKLKALEQLLAGETGRNIRFEKRSVEQEVIVATGRYEFHQLPEPFRKGAVTMCTDETDHAEREGGGGGTADSVPKFLEAVGNRVGMPVVDQTEPAGSMQIGYNHHSSSYLTRVKDPAEKAAKLKILLESLSQQTNLQFQVERRPADKWFVIEDKAGPAVKDGQP
jgi:hypothetical protein